MFLAQGMAFMLLVSVESTFAVFLASAGAAYITGTTIVVDGGQRLKSGF